MAALNSPFLLLLATIALFLHTNTAANVPTSHPGPGEYEPIPVDNYVEKLAKFAVEEHNKQTSDHLVYSETLSAEEQKVEGSNYRLVISAYGDNQKLEIYQAVVYVPLFGTKSLTSFNITSLPPPLQQFIPIPNAQNNAANVPTSHPGPGEFEPIPVDKYVQKLGSFAVQEYNAKFNIHGELTFSEVEKAAYQILAGTNYRLYLYAIETVLNTERRAPFEVYVYVAVSGEKTLTSFQRRPLLKAC